MGTKSIAQSHTSRRTRTSVTTRTRSTRSGSEAHSVSTSFFSSEGSRQYKKKKIIVEEKLPPLKRMHRNIKTITESKIFNTSIIIAIMLNAVSLGMETYDTFRPYKTAFKVVDLLFLFIYLVEFILKIIAEPLNYWKSGFNWYDFAVLLCSAIGTIFEYADTFDAAKLNVLKVFRSLRSLRTLRTVSFFRELQVVVTALVVTVKKWVLSIVVLLLLQMFLFAVIGMYLFALQENPEDDDPNFTTIPRGMLTLFAYVTLDGWTELSHLTSAAADGILQIFTIIFVFFGNFVTSNVMVGIIIFNISLAQRRDNQEQEEHRSSVLKYRKDAMIKQQKNVIKELKKRQRRGRFTNFQDMLDDFVKKLRHDEILTRDPETNPIWIECYRDTLDHVDVTTWHLREMHFGMINLLADHMERKLREKKLQKDEQRRMKRKMTVFTEADEDEVDDADDED